MASIDNEIRNKTDELFNDPITKLLLSRSHLTRVQAETLFIDSLSGDFEEKTFNSDLKAKIRSKNGHLTRGAFNRSLNQSKINIQKSIFTILLLSYVGILSDLHMESFEEAAEKLKKYLEVYKEMRENDSKSDEVLRTLYIIRSDLEEFLNEFIKV
jgi:hypothetical protein